MTTRMAAKKQEELLEAFHPGNLVKVSVDLRGEVGEVLHVIPPNRVAVRRPGDSTFLIVTVDLLEVVR